MWDCLFDVDDLGVLLLFWVIVVCCIWCVGLFLVDCLLLVACLLGFVLRVICFLCLVTDNLGSRRLPLFIILEFAFGFGLFSILVVFGFGFWC